MCHLRGIHNFMKKFFVLVIVVALILSFSSTVFAASITYGPWHGISRSYTNTIYNSKSDTELAYVYDMNYRCRIGSYENGESTSYLSRVCEGNTAVAPTVEINSGEYYVWDVYENGNLRLLITSSQSIYISGTFQVI